MRALSRKDGVVFFDYEDRNLPYSFKLDYKSKKVTYDRAMLRFLQDVRNIALSGKAFKRTVVHAVDRNRHVIFCGYNASEFRSYICEDILHLEKTALGYNVPMNVTPELIDSLYKYETIIKYHPYLIEALESKGAFDGCEVCEKENGYIHLDKTGTLYVEGKKVLEGCICCPKCGKKI